MTQAKDGGPAIGGDPETQVLTYCFLRADGRGPVSGAFWPPPHPARSAAWLEATEVVPRESRVQGYRTDDLPWWISDALWVVELDGNVTTHERHVAGDRGRLVSQITGWDRTASKDLAAACGFRTRDHVVSYLMHLGLRTHAEELAACPDLDSIVSRGKELETTAEGPARLAIARAWANANAGRAPRTGITAHLTAVVAAEVHVALGQRPTFDDGFLAERAWQASWLVERLDLSVPLPVARNRTENL